MSRRFFRFIMPITLVALMALPARSAEVSPLLDHTAQEQVSPIEFKVAPRSSGALPIHSSDTTAVFIATEPPCEADLDDDRIVGFADLVEVLSAWGACDDSCAADLTQDTFVDFSDVLIVLSAWGDCP